MIKKEMEKLERRIILMQNALEATLNFTDNNCERQVARQRLCMKNAIECFDELLWTLYPEKYERPY